jgi:hypothetical protein
MVRWSLHFSNPKLPILSLTYNAIKVAGVAAQISFTTATGLGTAAMKAQALAAQAKVAQKEGLKLLQ